MNFNMSLLFLFIALDKQQLKFVHSMLKAKQSRNWGCIDKTNNKFITLQMLGKFYPNDRYQIFWLNKVSAIIEEAKESEKPEGSLRSNELMKIDFYGPAAVCLPTLASNSTYCHIKHRYHNSSSIWPEATREMMINCKTVQLLIKQSKMRDPDQVVRALQSLMCYGEAIV